MGKDYCQILGIARYVDKTAIKKALCCTGRVPSNGIPKSTADRRTTKGRGRKIQGNQKSLQPSVGYRKNLVFGRYGEESLKAGAPPPPDKESFCVVVFYHHQGVFPLVMEVVAAMAAALIGGNTGTLNFHFQTGNGAGAGYSFGIPTISFLAF